MKIYYLCSLFPCPRISMFKKSKAAQKCRLPRAGRANNRNHFAGTYIQMYITKNLSFSKSFTHMFYLNQLIVPFLN